MQSWVQTVQGKVPWLVFWQDVKNMKLLKDQWILTERICWKWQRKTAQEKVCFWHFSIRLKFRVYQTLTSFVRH
ncbi:hypothetical protein D3C80_1054200 [compost metagenome]